MSVVISKLAKIFKLTDHETVKYSDLAQAPVLQWIDLMTSEPATSKSVVKFMRYPTKKAGQLIFITEIKAGSGYHYHMHDCKETITVMTGSCKINDKRVLEARQTETFYKGTAHSVMAHTACTIFVEFTKI
jgi:hypothetical protein